MRERVPRRLRVHGGERLETMGAAVVGKLASIDLGANTVTISSCSHAKYWPNC